MTTILKFEQNRGRGQHEAVVNYEKLSPLEQANFDAFWAEIQHLDDLQSAAVDKAISMTQEIFDSIMRLREEVGPELERTSMRVFLEYPEFALDYTNRLEIELGALDDRPEMPSLEIQLSYEKLKKRLRGELGVEI